jgi:histidyl-tRNA synthetase
MERLLLLLEQLEELPVERPVDAYMILVGDEAEKSGMKLAELIRDKIKDVKLQVNCGGGSFKSQFKKADKSGAEYAIIMGEDEVSRGEVSLKPLRADQEQSHITQNELISMLKNRF